jgi:hypothetical protein
MNLRNPNLGQSSMRDIEAILRGIQGETGDESHKEFRRGIARMMLATTDLTAIKADECLVVDATQLDNDGHQLAQGEVLNLFSTISALEERSPGKIPRPNATQLLVVVVDTHGYMWQRVVR